MKKSLMKFVFHAQEVADVTFYAMVETGRVVLHMERSNGHESSVDLIGRAFALPCLCYIERGWQRRGRLSGPLDDRFHETSPHGTERVLGASSFEIG